MLTEKLLEEIRKNFELLDNDLDRYSTNKPELYQTEILEKFPMWKSAKKDYCKDTQAETAKIRSYLKGLLDRNNTGLHAHFKKQLPTEIKHLSDNIRLLMEAKEVGDDILTHCRTVSSLLEQLTSDLNEEKKQPSAK